MIHQKVGPAHRDSGVGAEHSHLNSAKHTPPSGSSSSWQVPREQIFLRCAELRRLANDRLNRGEAVDFRKFGKLIAWLLAQHRPGRYFVRGREVPRRWPELTYATCAGQGKTHELKCLGDAQTAFESGVRAGQKLAARHTRFPGQDRVALLLKVTPEERKRLRLTFIGDAHSTREQRHTRSRGAKRARDRASKAEKRRANGCKSRRDYEEQSISSAEPWKALGIARATWYRRGRPSPETSASAHHLLPTAVTTKGEATDLSHHPKISPATTQHRAYIDPPLPLRRAAPALWIDEPTFVGNLVQWLRKEINGRMDARERGGRS